MISTILLLMAADPSGLAKALDSAKSAEVRYFRLNTVRTFRADELKRLAKLIDCKDDVRPQVRSDGAIATNEIFVISILSAEDRVRTFTLVSDVLGFDDREVTLANSDFRWALREAFEGPRPPKPGFKPKVFKDLPTEGQIVALSVTAEGMVQGADSERNCLTSFGSGVYRFAKDVKHEKLVAPHAIAAATDRFVYLAGRSGIAGFRRTSPSGPNLEPSEFVNDTATALHAVDGKLYAARKAEIWVYEIAGEYGRLHFQDRTLNHKLLEQPVAMASAKGHLYVVTAGGSLLTFKDDKFVSAESEPREAMAKEEADKSRTACLAIDGDKLYTVGIGEGLAVWDIAKGKPELVTRAAREGKESLKLRAVQHIAVAGKRIWVSGYAGNLLAWFEWADDELVLAGSQNFGEIYSLASSPPRPGDTQYLYAACENSVKSITAKDLPSPFAPPEPP